MKSTEIYRFEAGSDYSCHLNRLTQKKLCTTRPVYTKYTYAASAYGGNYTTMRLDNEKLDNTTYQYYYDSVGNITGIDKAGAAYRRYTYDNKNQLLSEANSSNGVTTTFTYDELGNILTKNTTDKTVTYRYGKDANAGWNNILTGVNLDGNTDSNGKPVYDEATESIKYDGIGNPTIYLGASLDWYGRQLKSYNKGATSVTYTYDSDGIRGTKIHNGTKSTYYYVSGQLRYEERGNLKFYYFYDASGNLSAIRYYPNGGTTYYMYYTLTNQQGDIIALYDANANLVASYEYDAWGKVLSVKNANGTDITSPTHIANLNPIRYRGYYYDTETKLYYLQSRYYNPQVGRFLNADLQISGVGGDVLGNNVFAYCFNNPVNSFDPIGMWTFSVSFNLDATAILGFSISFSISFDNKFNIAIQKSHSAPNIVTENQTYHQGILDIGAAGAIQVTDDETVFDLEGPTSYAGFSVGAGKYVGFDAVYSGVRAPDENTDNTMPNGYQISFGYGYGLDYHFKTTQTETIKILN